jgi:hypothetical protein
MKGLGAALPGAVPKGENDPARPESGAIDDSLSAGIKLNGDGWKTEAGEGSAASVWCGAEASPKGLAGVCAVGGVAIANGFWDALAPTPLPAISPGIFWAGSGTSRGSCGPTGA